MTRSADRPLNSDEIAFLAGSLFTDNLTAVARVRKPPTAFGALWRLLRRMREERPLTAAEAAAIAGRPRETLPFSPPEHLDPQRSRRYAAGLSLLSGGSMGAGVLSAYGLLVWRATPTGLRKLLTPKPRRAPKAGRKSAAAVRRPGLEPWDDDAFAGPEAAPQPWDLQTDAPFSDPNLVGAPSERSRNAPKIRAAGPSPALRRLDAWDVEPAPPEAEPESPEAWSGAPQADEAPTGSAPKAEALEAWDEASPAKSKAGALEAWDEAPSAEGAAAVESFDLWDEASPARSAASGIEALEAWDEDDAQTAEHWGKDEVELPALGGDEERAELPNAAERAELESQAAEWLADLGSQNSGVRIEPYAARLVGLLEASALKAVLAFAERRGGDSLALRALDDGLRGEKLGKGERLALRRLSSIFACAETGYELPPRRLQPEYAPVPGSVFYLLHMRDPYEINGYVSRTHLVLTTMKAAGLRPTAVTRLGFPNDLARHRQTEIEVETLVDGVPTLSLPDPRNGQFGRPVAEYVDAYAERIVELARERRPACIQAASNYLNGLAAIKAGRTLGIPVIYEVRGIWEITQASANEDYAGTLRYRLQRRLENLAVASADRVVAISEPLRRFVIEQGAEEARVSILPNGVDAAHMRPVPRDAALAASLGIGPEETVIGYIGSIVRYEGLDYVVRALRILKDEGVSGFRFLCVGDGAELEALRRLAANLGVADLCLFPGRVPRDQVEGLYSLIHVAPVPRRSLPVTELVPPLKPFEAMAAGKAVIVSSVEAVADMVIHERTGLVVRKDDVAELAAALRRMIVDPAERQRLGREARAWVARERSVPALAGRLAALYESFYEEEPSAALAERASASAAQAL